MKHDLGVWANLVAVNEIYVSKLALFASACHLLELFIVDNAIRCCYQCFVICSARGWQSICLIIACLTEYLSVCLSVE